MGGNYWYFCETKEAVLEAGKLIMDEIMDVPGVIAPFGVCSAASKPETNYPWIGPTSNHPYCPSLKNKLGEESKVPNGVNYIPEIVLNSVNQKQLNLAIKNSVDAILEVPGVLRISAGNFGGKLGDNTTNLLDILK
jgi:formylmethanofuran--tetrahydromethanopterin N-formyltransferase